MKHISELVEGAQSVLQQLWEKNHQVQQVNQTLPNILPEPLLQHCRVVNVREQIAVIYTDSAAWATRLRYLVPQILQVWQQHSFTITKIEIRVHLETFSSTESTSSVAPPETTVSKNRGPYPLTQNAANYLRHTAEATTHPRLKAVLLRLANRSHQTGSGCK